MGDDSIEDRAQNVRDEADTLAYNNAVALSIAEKRDVAYGKWVEVEFSEGLKSCFQNFSDDEPQPFKQMERKGGTWGSGSNPYLELNNTEMWGTSDAVHLMLKAGWMVRMKLFTENFRHFEENIVEEYQDRFSDDSFQQRGGMYDEFIKFWFIQEDDYISVDIDEEHSGIANFALRLHGVKYTISNPENFDNECEIKLMEAWKWNATWGLVQYVEETDTAEDVVEEQEELVIDDDDIVEETNDDDEVEGGNTEDELDDDTTDEDLDDDDTEDDDTDEEGDYSIFLVLGAVALILVGSIYILRGGFNAKE